MFKFTKLEIPGLILVEAQKFADERGFFSELYKESEFRNGEIKETFSQDNLSKSKRGVLRGMHYQLKPMEQGKLVSVASGSVFDVVIDIRKSSPHFGKWFGIELSEKNNRMLWVPPGFAHGILALEDNTVLSYKVTKEYSKEHESGILWNDPDVGIDWPIKNPIVSEKDQKHPRLKDAKTNFTYQ